MYVLSSVLGVFQVVDVYFIVHTFYKGNLERDLMFADADFSKQGYMGRR